MDDFSKNKSYQSQCLGMVLVVSLFMLFLISMLSLGTIYIVSQREKTINAVQDSAYAYQGAELALSYCESSIRADAFELESLQSSAALPPGWPNRQSIWLRSLNVPGTELPEAPVCIIEFLGYAGSSVDIESQYRKSAVEAYGLYRVSAYAKGYSGRGESMLESIFVY